MQGSYSATYSTGCDKPVCTRATLWRQHYITTSKEYITNSHILSIYFELAFLQLHLLKISCKLIIIWVNYERNKKGACFFETQCSYVIAGHWPPTSWPQASHQLNPALLYVLYIRTAGVSKRARIASLYHPRQCGIVLRPRLDGADCTFDCFMTHDCSWKLRK